MASKYWIKLYHEILDDPKMGRMPDRLWRRTIELFLLAGELNMDGILPEPRDIAWRLRISDSDIADDLSLLETCNIVNKDGGRYVVTKFADRQSAMTSTERTRRWRDEQKHNEYETVHYGNGDDYRDDSGTNRHTDIDIDIDKDIDKNDKGDSDLFSQCQAIYEQKKGLPVTDGRSFALMVKNFKDAGVTADDYAAAIDAMDADERYKGSKPTSYEKWAIGYADKRKHPAKGKSGKEEVFDLQKFTAEVFND